jgi:selenocysteine-specific elongation factor
MANLPAPFRPAGVVAVAGASGHGKSDLVRELTGVDPDRLPEERRLGRTTDLGFAPAFLPGGAVVGLIDLPGHERSIRTAIAGASVADAAVLVVAADRGPQEGTREHRRILDLLGVPVAAVARTRSGPHAPDAAVLGEAPLVEGAAGLRAALESWAASGATAHDAPGPFRMPLLRTFPSPDGRGAVVTGVPLSGRVRPGDVVEILPSGKRLRVAAVHAYRTEVPEARPGHTAGLHLPDLENPGALARGFIAAAPGTLGPSTALAARVRLGAALPAERSSDAVPVTLHLGPAELSARMVVLEDVPLEPGRSVWVQFRLDEPVFAVPGDRALARRGNVVLAGGRIVETGNRRRRRSRPEDLQALEAASCRAEGPVEEALRRHGPNPARIEELSARLGLAQADVRASLEVLSSSGRAAFLHDGRAVHEEGLRKASDLVYGAVDRFHRRHPRRRGPTFDAILEELSDLDEALFWQAAAALVRSGRLVAEGGHLRRTDFSPVLSPQEKHTLRELEGEFLRFGFQLPARAEMFRRLLPRHGPAGAQRVLDLLEDLGAAVVVGDGLLLHEAVLERARRAVGEALDREGPLETPRLKEILGVSRRYALPILERLDAVGFTERVGNARVRRAPAERPLG